MKNQQKTMLERQLKQARLMKAAAAQQLTIATQLESEAISGLNAMGAQTGRAREGKLTDDQRLSLISGLTKVKK